MLSKSSEPVTGIAITVQQEVWGERIRAQGGLVADDVATIGAQVAGRVAEVPIQIGDVVAEGAVLCRLDDRDLQIQVQQAAAQLAQACAAIGASVDADLDQLDREQSPPVKQEFSLLQEAQANYLRAEQLRQQGTIPAADFEQTAAAKAVAEARYKSALNAVEERIALIRIRRADLLLAQQRLSETTITAPFAGSIRSRSVSPGVYLSVGTAVATLVRTDPLRFRGSVPERQALKLRVGQTVEILVAGLAQPVQAHVSRISPSLDESNRSLVFEADVSNPDAVLRDGLFAEADIVVDEQARAVTVPASSLSEFAGVQKVWLIREGQVVEQLVTTGRKQPDRIEIVSGLSEGDQILVDGEQGRTGPWSVASDTKTEPAAGGIGPEALPSAAKAVNAQSPPTQSAPAESAPTQSPPAQPATAPPAVGSDTAPTSTKRAEQAGG
jgi:RND family efflux transporter MFP subunit